jgi:O-antigen/teichoic acid export membrane protein
MEEINNKRSKLIRNNIILSFFTKGWSAIVLLMIVPVTLNCLGEYKNGVWLTISSLLLWIENMDIGLGNGLRNTLAIHLAHNDIQKAKSVISSAYAMLTLIMIPIAIVLFVLIKTYDTYILFNVSTNIVTNLDSLLIVTSLLVCTSFIFKLIGNFYMGLQLPAISNLLIACGQTLTLFLTYLVYLSGSHSMMHIALANTLSPLIVYFVAYIYSFYYKYPHLRPSIKVVHLRQAKEVMGIGVKFFVIQISGVILFMSSNLLISNLFTPSMVTPYQICFRYFSLLLAIFTVICMPYWTATTDAYERHDMEWIRKTTKKLDMMMLAIFICMMMMIACSDYIYSIWIGNDISIDIKLSISMAVYVFILIYSERYSYIINGFGMLRLQLIFTVGAAILFIPLAYFVVNWKHDITWFVAVMCLVNIPGMIVNRIQFYKIINSQAKGIWSR